VCRFLRKSAKRAESHGMRRLLRDQNDLCGTHKSAFCTFPRITNTGRQLTVSVDEMPISGFTSRFPARVQHSCSRYEHKFLEGP
jgi:hypothetical protein